MMEERLQRRVQRYGWDQAAAHYEELWKTQFQPAHDVLGRSFSTKRGDSVLDVACGTGLVALQMASLVGSSGTVIGVDLSQRMVETATERARVAGIDQVSFRRMDAEQLDFPDQTFNRVVCAFGLMYFPDPVRALQEMWRVLRPDGSLQLSVWGDRRRCGWARLFEIVAAEVSSDVCPLFFRLGTDNALATALATAGFGAPSVWHVTEPLKYANGDRACDAMLLGGPVAMAWSRFSPEVRERVRARYLESIAPWKTGDGYSLPCEIVVATAPRAA